MFVRNNLQVLLSRNHHHGEGTSKFTTYTSCLQPSSSGLFSYFYLITHCGLRRSFARSVYPLIHLYASTSSGTCTLEHPPWWWSSIAPPTTALPHNTQLNPSITGSGKSTFLSLLTGDHPQSYAQALPSLSPATSSSPSSSITQATKTYTNSSVV